MAEKTNIVINTKVTPSAKKRLDTICRKYGFSLYDMLQMMCDCLIRYMDDFHNLDENLIRIIRMFEGLPGWKNAFRLTEDMSDAQVMEAFYVLRHPKGKGASRLVHVRRPVIEGDADSWQVTYNSQEQLKRFIELTNESLYKHLHMIGVELGTQSFIDTIHRIADAYSENPDEVELRLQFENNDWHKGAQLHERPSYKRPYTHGMDAIERGLFDRTTKS